MEFNSPKGAEGGSYDCLNSNGEESERYCMANYTLKAIIENFEAMLVEMPFNKVTVSALVKRCEISSNTFYYHFRDIYELLERWIAIKVDKYINLDSENWDWAESLKTMLKAMQANSKIIYHIWDAISKESLERFVFGSVQDWFCEATKKHLSDTKIPDQFMQAIAEFYCYSILGFVLKFLWDHMRADVDQSVDWLSNVFEGVSDYIIMNQVKAFDPNIAENL